MCESRIIKEKLEVIKKFKDKFKKDINKVTIYAFNQWWGSTTGGFSGIGGCAMTEEPTIVIIDKEKSMGYVYFKTRLAYTVKLNVDNKLIFMKDIEDENISGVDSYKDRYLIKES